MSANRPWQLPDGIDELLPTAAAHVEDLRRRLLDCAARWGYQLVIPPMVEYTDSLLVGVGEDLDLLTFKVPDQLSGRMLGLRADMTPQVARMDAHSLRGEGVNRLCYAGSTLHTRSRSLTASRSPLQLGAELYGEPSLDGDVEVIDLMLSMLAQVGVAPDGDLTLDLGHGAIARHVLAVFAADHPQLEGPVFDALQRKSRPDLEGLLQDLPGTSPAAVLELLDLHGDLNVLDRAEQLFGDSEAEVRQAIADLRRLAATLSQRYPDLPLYIDLVGLRGYRYHTGVVFAVYARGLGQALARGGRYDNVGEVYGRARPATGFATDLRLLAGQVSAQVAPIDAIAAPIDNDPALQDRIRELRASGHTVIVATDGVPDERCRQMLKKIDGQWALSPIPQDGDER